MLGRSPKLAQAQRNLGGLASMVVRAATGCDARDTKPRVAAIATDAPPLVGFGLRFVSSTPRPRYCIARADGARPRSATWGARGRMRGGRSALAACYAGGRHV